VDLSTKHGPVSRLFDAQRNLLTKHPESKPFQLSADQLAHYEELGYVAGIRIFTEEQCDVLCEQLAELTNPNHEMNHLFHEYNSNESEDPNRVLFHALGAWRAASAFHDSLWNPAFTVAASQILGGAVRFWHDQLFCKPSHHGGVVAWHQDYSYWTRTQPMNHLTCWIGLDDATEANGCLQYIPGSHKWELLPITGLAGDMEAIQTVLSDEQKAQFDPVSIEMKRGEAAFHHPLLVHGSYENNSEFSRRALVINTILGGVCSDADEPLLEGVPVVPKGEALDGQFFPLLYDPA
jgi:ectoine hydroxylase-related dioxygenase (phytanoyl-CoA dioxygenase family)